MASGVLRKAGMSAGQTFNGKPVDHLMTERSPSERRWNGKKREQSKNCETAQVSV
jgi:hypothetical protein